MLPEPPIALNPARGALHGARLEAAAPHAPLLGVREQAGPLQHPQVLVYSGERNAKGPRELADGRFTGGQLREDRAPGGVGQGGEHRVEIGAQMINHMVKC